MTSLTKRSGVGAPPCRTSPSAAVLEPAPLTADIEQDETPRDETEVLRCLVPASEIVAMRDADFADKKRWFHDKCNALEPDWWKCGHVHIKVRNGRTALVDSLGTVLGLDRAELRMVWSYNFEGEPVRGDNSAAEKWYGLVIDGLCDPAMGLLRKSGSSLRPGALQINPWSEILYPKEHLRYFRFMGRILGKALFDGQHVFNLFVPYLYKFIAWVPITLDDLKEFDSQYYDLLRRLEGLDDISSLGLNFSVTERIPYMGETQTVELFRGGESLRVTEQNLGVYEKALMRYVLFGRIRSQLTELLRGIFEVVPRAMLSIFEPFELEVLMCGSSR